MVAQQKEKRFLADQGPGAPDRMAVTVGLRLDRESQPLFEIGQSSGLFLSPLDAPVGRAEVRGVIAKVVAINGFVAGCGDDPDLLDSALEASSAMIWRTGLVSPSRSTSGSMAFCTVSDAGYCRAPRPAAVITALVICTAGFPLCFGCGLRQERPIPSSGRLHP